MPDTYNPPSSSNMLGVQAGSNTATSSSGGTTTTPPPTGGQIWPRGSFSGH